jgi:hypothetical protein
VSKNAKVGKKKSLNTIILYFKNILNVFNNIKHNIIKLKLKNTLILIIKLKNTPNKSILRFILWLFSLKKITYWLPFSMLAL